MKNIIKELFQLLDIFPRPAILFFLIFQHRMMNEALQAKRHQTFAFLAQFILLLACDDTGQ